MEISKLSFWQPTFQKTEATGEIMGLLRFTL